YGSAPGSGGGDLRPGGRGGGSPGSGSVLARGGRGAVPRAVVALLAGFRQGARRGQVFQQGGTFVLGPGETVRFEWRDRFPGDHPSMEDVRAALS
ncbi:MAG: hypothetical protein AAB328_13920, partial [candidate division NC10 bacterium]